MNIFRQMLGVKVLEFCQTNLNITKDILDNAPRTAQLVAIANLCILQNIAQDHIQKTFNLLHFASYFCNLKR